MSTKETPQQVWEWLQAGNARYAADTAEHPHSGLPRREEMTAGQSPRVVVLGCSDSRVPVEMIYDMGLGDAFVIRTAGHILDDAVLASLQFAIDDLGCTLVVVLGHQSCGAVGATAGFLDQGADLPPGYQRHIVEQVALAATKARRDGLTTRDAYERSHVIETLHQIQLRVPGVAGRIESGGLGLVGARYRLEDGVVETVELHGVA